MELFDLICDNMMHVTGDLKHIIDSISSQRSLSEEEFIKICAFIRDLKFMVNEIEYNARIKPMTDDIKSLLRDILSINEHVLHAQPLCDMNIEPRSRKHKNSK